MKASGKSGILVISLLVVPALLAGLAFILYVVTRPSGSPAAPVPTVGGTASTVPVTAATVPVTGGPDLTQTQLSAPRTGILEAGEELFHEGYRMQNAWAGSINGVFAYVVAGAHQSDPDGGVVEVTRQYQNAAYVRFFDTPTRSGSVRIMAESNHRLTLQSTDGTTFYFDVPSESFVADLSQVVASLQPPPTFTSTSSPVTPVLPTPGGYPGSVEETAIPAATAVPVAP
jgi:hypothetical protein